MFQEEAATQICLLGWISSWNSSPRPEGGEEADHTSETRTWDAVSQNQWKHWLELLLPFREGNPHHQNQAQPPPGCAALSFSLPLSLFRSTHFMSGVDELIRFRTSRRMRPCRFMTTSNSSSTLLLMEFCPTTNTRNSGSFCSCSSAHWKQRLHLSLLLMI